MTNRPALSCALPPSAQIVEYARVAERLSYRRIWVFDSPALYGDLWIALARIAEGTDRIGLGSGVAVPSLRHPMVTASAIATIEELAPGRLVAAFGSGYTGRLVLGQKAMRWAALGAYVEQVRALLEGEVVDIDGGACQMVHSPGWAPPRPIRTPLWLAPSGPKGFAVAREIADGVLVTGPPEGSAERWGGCALLTFGTVVRPGEDHTSPRLIEAAAPAYVGAYHAMWEWAPAALDGMPGGTRWAAAVRQERPEGQRHLAVHEGHLSFVTERDRPLVDAAGPAILTSGWTGDAHAIAARFDEVGAAGVTEIAYVPAGPDIPGELEAFAAAAQA